MSQFWINRLLTFAEQHETYWWEIFWEHNELIGYVLHVSLQNNVKRSREHIVCVYVELT